MNFDQKRFTPTTHIGDKGNECRSTIYDKPVIKEDTPICYFCKEPIKEVGEDRLYIWDDGAERNTCGCNDVD